MFQSKSLIRLLLASPIRMNKPFLFFLISINPSDTPSRVPRARIEFNGCKCPIICYNFD